MTLFWNYTSLAAATGLNIAISEMMQCPLDLRMWPFFVVSLLGMAVTCGAQERPGR